MVRKRIRKFRIHSQELTKAITLRPAAAADFPAIRAIIRAVKINPMSLDWRHFLVAVDSEGDIVGCGQIKVHRDGSHELASIAVVPAWRGGGVARRIIESLNAAHPETLFLTCRERLGPFYKKFGFMIVDDREMTPYFQRIWRISHWLSALGLVHDDLLVMKRPGTTPHS